MITPARAEHAAIDILLSQKFLPEPGGSIRWMYEVYRRWPRPIEVITHDYDADPPNTAEFPEVPPPPDGRDHVNDPNLRIQRHRIFINNWGLDSPKRLLRYARMTRIMNQKIRDHGRVRVHCTHAVPEVVSLLPLRWWYGDRLKVVCYAHGEEVTACCSSRQLRFLMHRAHRIVDLMIANSQYTASVLADHIDPARVRVVHPGVAVEAFGQAGQAGAAWRREHGLTDELVVLTVGRLDPRKNHAAVIRAVASLVDKYPRLVYVVVGQGRQMPALRAQVRNLNVADKVIFTGLVDARTQLAVFGGCDVFAMPAIRDRSDVEGFGIVFLEAGVCGKPSIAGCQGGQVEAVIDGQTGLIVDGTDQAAVTAALDRLLGDRALRHRLGQSAREHAANFNWDRVVRRTVELVEGFA